VPSNLIAPEREHEGLAACVRQTLGSGGGAPDLIFGDGLANEVDDEREVRACHDLFGDASVPLTAFTGSFGFPGAAAGAFALAHAMLSMRRGVVPPIINCDEPEVEHPVDLVREPRQTRLRRALVWTSDRGIKNASVLAAAVDPSS